MFLIRPVHLKVIQGVHLIRCYQITDKQFGMMELYDSRNEESLPEEGIQLELF